jgi:hypothetical protein
MSLLKIIVDLEAEIETLKEKIKHPHKRSTSLKIAQKKYYDNNKEKILKKMKETRLKNKKLKSKGNATKKKSKKK